MIDAMEPDSGRCHLNVDDLAAAIVERAVRDWRIVTGGDTPVVGTFITDESPWLDVCFGNEALGFKRCAYADDCFNGHNKRRASRKWKSCTWRRSALMQELIAFFNSDWFELLCGDLDPAYIRQKIGVPDITNERARTKAV